MGRDKPWGTAVALNGYGTERGEEREVLPWPDVVQVAETAEETGYEGIFVPEIGAREAFGAVAGLAVATTAIRLATGVVRLGSRDPRRVAMGAATLHDLSGGRFVLGVGSRQPIEATRGALRQIRALLAGERGGPDLDPIDLSAPAVAVYLAALGPRMAELAGESADGVVLNWCTPERVSRAREEVARGAEAAGRDPGEVTVAVYVRACLGHEEAHAAEALGWALGRYAAMPPYARQFEAMGLGNEAEAAGRAWTAGRPEEVPPDLLRAVTVRGSRQAALERLSEYGDGGADLVVVYPVPALEGASSIMGTVMAAAPSPTVER